MKIYIKELMSKRFTYADKKSKDYLVNNGIMVNNN